MKFIHALKKELLLLLRDPAGLGVLFLLPGIMVFLVAYIQDMAFEKFTDIKMPLVIVDEDHDSLSVKIVREFKAAAAFEIITEIGGKPANRNITSEKVSTGEYQLAVIIPQGATKRIRSQADDIMGKAFGQDSSNTNILDTSVHVSLLYDPALMPSFRASVNANLDKYITQIQTDVLVDAFSEKLQHVIPNMQPISMKGNTSMEVREKFAQDPENTLEPNAVQHNVPAWTIFAMFFIVIPLATNMVREKDNGIETRLRTIPGSYVYSIAGKMAAYQIVCFVQFCFMISVGILAMPVLGLPALEIGNNILELIITAGFTALAGTAFGIFVGTICNTHDQAASFGSISVLIAAAIGGIWVPTFLMPAAVKTIGSFSPLNWSLAAFYDIFLRNASYTSLWPQWLKLFAFTVILAGISATIKKIKKA